MPAAAGHRLIDSIVGRVLMLAQYWKVDRNLRATVQVLIEATSAEVP
jgi:hypothetical protein